MKQKMIYIVLLIVSMYLPASSNECSKIFQKIVPAGILQVAKKPSAAVEEINSLPVSPFSKLLINL